MERYWNGENCGAWRKGAKAFSPTSNGQLAKSDLSLDRPATNQPPEPHSSRYSVFNKLTTFPVTLKKRHDTGK